ncbi:MAG: 4-oxalocrotonate tautomerase family protein [Proteobacteria bacterium]|nr:4-oxalocrotonate tautomerase family protein [Pseudomonadota bacterium]
MPYINVRLIDDNISAEKKAEIINRITTVMVETLGKDPNTTFVVIDEVHTDNWGVGGQSVTERRAARAREEQKTS